MSRRSKEAVLSAIAQILLGERSEAFLNLGYARQGSPFDKLLNTIDQARGRRLWNRIRTWPPVMRERALQAHKLYVYLPYPRERFRRRPLPPLGNDNCWNR